jgi:hypothetical protein
MPGDPPHLAQLLEQIAAELRQLPESRHWIDDYFSGEMLYTYQAAEIASCSDETIRRKCEAAVLTDRRLGILIAGSVWLVSRSRLFDHIELHDGKPAMLAARSRAEKLAETWSPPQQSRRRRVAATG